MSSRLRVIVGPLLVFVGVSWTIGCGAKPPGPRPSDMPGTLSVASFSAVGWHANGEFHYRPSIQVTAASAGSAVAVSMVRVEGSGDGGSVRSATIRFPNGRRISPGDRVDLSTPFLEIVTDVSLNTLRVTVEFADDAGRAGSIVAESAAPALTLDSPNAELAIRSFIVTRSFNTGQFWYQPKLTLAETTGRGHARIVNITFELLDVGPAGRVPPSRESFVVPPGGTIVLDEDPLGYGPWLEISSSANASRVSVVIQFVDEAGRGGSVTAIAGVS